jgi:hypothetical protein
MWSVMEPTALTVLDIALEDPADEEGFHAWWAEAEALLRKRGRLARAELAVDGRGRYLALLEFPLAGSWQLVTGDRPWQELEGRRPPARVTSRELRLWHRAGVRDLTTAQLRRWLDERAAGTRDFVLVDALTPAKFEAQHLPGAINLPADAIDEAVATAALGARDRPVVIYCAGYT